MPANRPASNRIDVHGHYLRGAVAEKFRSGFRLAGGYQIAVHWSPDEALAYPGRFGAFAAVPGDSPEAMLAEIEYALDTLHLDGVLLNSNTRGEYFGMPFYEPVLAELNRRQVPVFVHPIDGPQILELGMGRPSSVIEFTFDTTRNITNGLYRGVFQRYPDLKLILAHCGGPLPTLAWRTAEHTTMGSARTIRPSTRPMSGRCCAACTTTRRWPAAATHCCPRWR